MSVTTAQKKEKAILDTFQLFYEELPTTLKSVTKSARLQRRSKR